MKRVLIIEPAGLLWGSEKALLDLLHAIDRTQFAVTVACPADSPIVPHVHAIGIQTAALPSALLHTRGRAARLHVLLKLTKLLIRLRPHVIHLNQGGLMRIAAVPAALLGIPVVTHIRIAEDVALLRDRMPAKLAPKIAIAISEGVATQLRGVASEVRLVYDPYWATPPVRDRDAVRRSLQIPLDAPVICFPARLCEGKRHDLLLHAASLLSNTRTHLLIVGGDAPHGEDGLSFGDSIRQLADELMLNGRVTFTGMRDDVIDLLAASDLAVLPSERETFGRVLLEALSAGVPIVGTNEGGPREIIGHNERGFLFARGDVRSLTAAITQALTEPAEAARRTAVGAEWVGERCSPLAHAKAIEAIYAGLEKRAGTSGGLS